MKRLYLYLTFLGLVISQYLFGQCPPAGFPQPGNTCATAPILCENLDGYCATINNNNTQQNFPGCPGWWLNNDEWFAFFAGSTTITIVVTPSNCSSGGMQGLQGGIYQACGPPWISMDLQCSCTTNPFTLTANNFVIGQVYYFVLDGCNGNVCDYSIDVTSGSTVGVPPNNPGAISGPTSVCAGTASNFSVSPVYAATVYNWTLNPASAGTVTANNQNVIVNWANNASGTAELCLTVANLCYSNPAQSCITVDVNPKPTAAISGSGILCFGSNTPVNLPITFTGEAPWTFVYRINGVAQPPIQTSDNPYILPATQPGTYTLQSVTGAGNCTGTVSGSATVTLNKMNLSTVITKADCGQSTGSVNLSVSGGNPPYTFNWSNSQTTEDIGGLPPGTYTVVVTDEDGCTETLTATVGDNLIPLNITGTVQASTTCNGGNGSIDVTVTPAGTYTYEWSNGVNTVDQTNLPPGTYTLTVSSGITCTATAEFTVDDSPLEPNITPQTVSTTCDLSNGSINLTVNGGVSPYTFLWGGGETTPNLTGIPAGTYAVTVTGANGCTSTEEITVENDNPPFTINGNVVANTTCNGGNGSIDVSISPPGNYTYEWSTLSSAQDQNNLSPGTYTVTVSAGGSCVETAEFTVDDDPLIPNINAQVTASTCDLNNGSISLSVTGGVSPYSYLWQGGQATSSLSNIPAGSYAVTVTGANGCFNTADITVDNNNPPINISANVVSNTNCLAGNGSINVSVAPPAAYTYLWSNNATSQDLNNLPPGTYTITVSAGGSCTETAEFTVDDEPNEPNINAFVNESTCELNNGSINLSVSGGVAPFAYLWFGGQTTSTLNNIPAGTYSVTVTGVNGCTGTTEITVDNNNPPIDITANIFASTACVGGNGSIDISISPTGAYTYLWSTNATTQDINGLAPGSYTVTVSMGGSCSTEASFDVPEDPNAPDLSFTFIPATCGLSNGSINLSVFGGVQPYTYLWSSGQSSQDINNLPEDLYIVTVTGANGCTMVDGVSLPNDDIPITIDADVFPQTSCIGNNGKITLFLTPGNLSVLWSNSSTTPTINNLAPGAYTVTVSAGGTCTETASFTVEDESESPALGVEVVPSSCGFKNGAIDLDVFSGIAPYTYNWSNSLKTQDLANLGAGTYVVTVTSAVGCTSLLYVDVPNEDIVIEIYGYTSDNISCTTPNGSIDLDILPVNNYQYSWSNNLKTQDLNNLPAGTYTVTVSFGQSCSAVASFDIYDMATVPNVSVVGIPATCNQSNGGADATVSGASAPYTYLWSNSLKTEDLTNLTPGTYSVTVSDFFGCTATASVAVANNNIALNLSGIPAANTSCAAPNGAIDISVAPAGNYVYLWSNTAVTQDVGNLAPGSYTVTVSLGSSCSATATYAVANNTADPVIMPLITAAICGQNNGGIDLTVSGGLPPYAFIWSNSAVSEDLVNIYSGTYTVIVSDANGCLADTVLNVANNSSTFTLTGQATPLTSCSAANGAIDLVVNPAGPYTYQWSNSALSEDLSNLPAGAYTVSVTETGNCTATATFIVNDGRNYPVATQNVTPELCNLANGSIDLSVSGGTGPFDYLWSGNQTTEDLNNLSAGFYSVVVTGANGCTTSASASVPGNAVSFSVTGATAPNSSCLFNTGSVDLSITPAISGTGIPYSFNWSNTLTSEDLTGLAPGNYTVTVSAGGTCTATAGYTIVNTALPPTTGSNVTPSFCGQNSGAINLSVTGGQTPYLFSWSNNAATEDVSGLSPDNYSVTVTGSNGCSVSDSFVVPENTVTPAITGILSANTLCVGANGSIALGITPSLAYSFIWSGGQTSQNLAGLAAGSYTVTVNGGGACTDTATFVVLNDTQAPDINGVVLSAFCGQKSGGVDLNTSGGQAPYSFIWTTGGTAEDLSAVATGTYTVTVTGANGCTVTQAFDVPEDVITPAISGAVTANTSCVAANGSISLGVLPALAYQYLWSGGQTNSVLAGIPAGTYMVTVNGGGACTATAVFVVDENAALVALNGQSTDILCFGDKTGAIDLTVNGGTPPFQYAWSPGAPGNPEDLANLGAGTYAVTVTDPLGCSSSTVFVLKQPAAALQLNCTQSNNVSFPGAGDGGAIVTISGGTAPFTVSWSPGSTQSNVPAGNFAINNLAVGNYAVTVTDANGCPSVCSFDIELLKCETALGTMQGNLLLLCGPGCLTASYNAAGQFLEPGDVLQFILHNGTGNQIVNEISRSDKPGFCFDPAIMSYGTTYFISAVAGNNDGTGNVDLSHFCTVVNSGTPIVFQQKPVAGIEPAGSINCAVKHITLNGTSDISGSDFDWVTGGGLIIGSPAQATVTAGAAGIYTLTVSANGCLDTAFMEVKDITNQPNAVIYASPGDVLDCTINEIVLAGAAEGTQNANTVWVYNGSVFPGGSVLPVDQPGLYQFVILDTITECTDTALINISENQAYPPLFLNPPGLLTCIHPTVVLSGGSALPGITFAWATVNGTDTIIVGTGSNFVVSAPGVYYLLGTDPINHCSNALSATVSADQTIPVADAGAPFSIACYGETAHLDASASGGAPTLTYFWTSSDGSIASGSNTVSPEINEPGTYLLTVTNPVNGCSDTDAVVIDPEEPVVHLSVKQPNCIGEKGAIQVDSVSGGKPPVRYSLDNGLHFSVQNRFTQLGPGVYSLYVSDANGCTTDAEVTIVEGALFDLMLEPQVLLKLGDSYQINTQVNVPLTEIGLISWVPPVGLSCDTCLNPVATPLHTTRYQITAGNKAGCTDTAPILLVVDRNVDVYVPNIFSPDGDGQNDVLTIYADPRAVVRVKSFQVFSRWGELVYTYANFEPNNPAFGWNGKHHGQELNPAVFSWYAVLQFIDGTEKLYEGDVTLKR